MTDAAAETSAGFLADGRGDRRRPGSGDRGAELLGQPQAARRRGSPDNGGKARRGGLRRHRNAADAEGRRIVLKSLNETVSGDPEPALLLPARRARSRHGGQRRRTADRSRLDRRRFAKRRSTRRRSLAKARCRSRSHDLCRGRRHTHRHLALPHRLPLDDEACSAARNFVLQGISNSAARSRITGEPEDGSDQPAS